MMNYKQFMNTSTANPMHNELRRAINSLDTHQQGIVEAHWNTFFANFENFCSKYQNEYKGQGLYTTAIWALSSACINLKHAALSTDELQTVTALNEYTEKNISKAEKLDIKIELYWYEFAESYRNCMPHGNNQILEDFKREVAKTAMSMLRATPDKEINIIGTDAVQKAATELAGKHPNNVSLCSDMTRVSKVAGEQRSMIYDAYVAPTEPMMFLDDEGMDFALDEIEDELY